MVNSCGQLNYIVPMQAYTVGQFTITFAHSYTSNWQLGLLESSGEETTLHEKYAGCDLLSAKHRMFVSRGWGTVGLHPAWKITSCYMLP